MSAITQHRKRIAYAGLTYLALVPAFFLLFSHWLLVYASCGLLLLFIGIPVVGPKAFAHARIFIYATMAAFASGGLLGHYYSSIVSAYPHVA